MEWYEAGALLLGMIIAGMAIGLPVAFSFLLTNVIGIFVFSGGWSVMSRIVQDATSLLTTFTLLPIPMFILMGALFFQTGLAARVFDALDKLLGRLPGRLCFLTVMGGTLFSTLSAPAWPIPRCSGPCWSPKCSAAAIRSAWRWAPSSAPADWP